MPDKLNPNQSYTPSLQQCPIAIVGLAALFPQADNLNTYWDNIIQEVDCITDVPPSHWSIDDYYDPDPATPDKTYAKRGGFIPHIEFDPLEFGLPPNILEVTDSSQLLTLVAAKQALANAGYGPDRDFDHDRTGIILGVGGGQKLMHPLIARIQYPIWERVLRNSGLSEDDTARIIEKIKLAYVPWEENAFPGLLGNVIAGRVANRLDLGGTNCVVDAACAGSLAALKMASSELLENRADIMLTGGVDADNSVFMYLCFSETPAYSRQNKARPFDSESDGMMLGEGVGILVLKRLADAERDDDRIYALLKGIGSSSDGRFKSIYAPCSSGQAKALKRAYTDAGYPPQTVSLIEAHGTGTTAGDIAEFFGLKSVFTHHDQSLLPIALGSVKSQIGHTKAAAGTASLIKVILALYHKILPPTLNVSTPNAKLGLDETPFYLNAETRPWLSPFVARSSNHGLLSDSLDTRSSLNTKGALKIEMLPRRAGVSSFGFGGTNFHIALEEYTAEHEQAYRLHGTDQIIILSAPSAQQLRQRCDILRGQLQEDEQNHHCLSLVQASKEAHLPTSEARLGFVARSKEEICDYLHLASQTLTNNAQAEAWTHPKGVYYRQDGLNTRGQVVALFPGQGSQYLNMGKSLVMNFPLFRQAYQAMDELFVADGLPSLSSLVYPSPVFSENERLQQAQVLKNTEYAQPAIGVLSYGLYKCLQQAGFKPDFTAGHSFGEVTALWAAGSLTDADYLALVKARGQAMAPPNEANFEAGTMLAIKGDTDQLQQILAHLEGVTIANINSKAEMVIAGAKSTIQAVQSTLIGQGFTTMLLPVSAAFHSPFVRHAQQIFKQVVQKVSWQLPIMPVYANATAQPYPNQTQAISQTLSDHILQPVQFRQKIENIYEAGGRIFVEIGPRNVLTNFVSNILDTRPHLAIALNPSRQKDSDRQFRQAMAQLKVAGLTLSDIDPYQHTFGRMPFTQTPLPIQTKPKPKAYTVQINGSNYISPKTQQAFQEALQETKFGDGLQIKSASQLEKSFMNVQDFPVDLPMTNGESHTLTAEDSAATEGFLPSRDQPSNTETPVTKSSIISALTIQSTAEFYALQRDMLRVHEQYLTHQADYMKLFHQLIQTLSQNASPNPDIIAQHLKTFHEHQTETSRVHNRYLENHRTLTQALLGLWQTGEGPATISANQNLAETAIPSPEEPEAATSVVAQEEDSYHSFSMLSDIPTPPKQESEETILFSPSSPIAPSLAPAPTSPAISPQLHTFSDLLINVVSEKTGYPIEMLELDMDLEADLGIDSIKRVEIMGALQEQVPAIGDLDPESLVDLRTLGQITTYLQDSFGSTELGYNEKKENGSLKPEEQSDLNNNIPTRNEQISASAAQPLLSSAPLPTAPPPIVAQSPSPSLPYAVVKTKPLPLPDFLEFSLPPQHTCLITDDGGETSLKVAEILQGRGWPVVLLSFPQTLLPTQRTVLPQNIKQIILPDMEEAHLQQHLATIAQTEGTIGTFIHINPLWPSSWQPGSLSLNGIEKAVVKHVFLIAKYLQQPLTQAAQIGPNQRSAFLTVARLDGRFGLGQSSKPDFDTVGGGLFGLTKSLNLEWEAIFCRAIDLGLDISPEQAAYCIVAELHDPDLRLTEVGYNLQGRATLTTRESYF